MMKMKRLVLLRGWVGVAAAASVASAETLRLLTWSDLAPEVLVKKFRQETGIEVQVTLSNNEDIISRLRATGGFSYLQAAGSVPGQALAVHPRPAGGDQGQHYHRRQGLCVAFYLGHSGCADQPCQGAQGVGHCRPVRRCLQGPGGDAHPAARADVDGVCPWR